MKKTILAVVMTISTSVMAEDFRALGSIQATPVQNTELAVTEGGAVCNVTHQRLGSALCSFLSSGGNRPPIVTITSFPIGPTPSYFFQFIAF